MNLKEIINRYQSKHDENRTHYILKCPSCGREKLYLDKVKEVFLCFRCGIKGGLIKFVTHLYGCSFEEAKRIVRQDNRIDKHAEKIIGEFIESLLGNRTKDKEKHLAQLPDDFRPISFYNSNSQPVEYIENKRGITRKMADFFELGYSQKLQRIVFPIYFDENLVGWQARAIHNDIEPKILNYKHFSKSDFLYNYDNVSEKLNKMFSSDVPNKCNSIDRVLLCEGPIDCIKSSEYSSLALMGKSISKKQFNLILNLNPNEIFIGLDPDAREETEELAKKISGFVNYIYILELPSGIDLGDCSPNEVRRYISNAIPYNYSKWQMKKVLSVGKEGTTI